MSPDTTISDHNAVNNRIGSIDCGYRVLSKSLKTAEQLKFGIKSGDNIIKHDLVNFASTDDSLLSNDND